MKRPSLVRAMQVAAGLAAVKLAVHLATLLPYGIFRDELYYVACAHHLDWGYVDQPPLCVAVLRLWLACFGESLPSIRCLAALVGTATVFVTGLVAFELGGGLLAVALGALGVLVAGQYLGTAHYYSMNVFDQLFWPLVGYVLLRALERDRTREGRRAWLALGVTLGLGLLNKTSVLWLIAGILVGLVATPARTALKTLSPYFAGLLAALLLAPYLAWEIRHGWPTLEFMHNAMNGKYVARSFGKFLEEQVDQNNPFTLPLWTAGLLALLSKRLGERAAALGWVYVTAFVIVASQKTAKAEYLSPSYPVLMAAGGVFWERLLRKSARPWVAPVVVSTMVVGMLLGAAVSAPFALALLPEPRFIAFQSALGRKPESSERRELAELPQFFADMHGWRELTDTVAGVYDSLAPEERPGATIWCRSGGYGSAAAIDYFGPARGLPPAITGHNNYWYWGPGPGDGKAVIVVGGRSATISRWFESFEQVATFECRYCRPDENHKPIYVGRRMKIPLAEVWPGERYFD